ncbi:hypothetical protein B0A81_03075 [Flavobacterium plurextorum]|uniref:Uncharacterized protein n=1 Tax=Flavobacterium plurextorum TaxID=1114867 RepID=A0ABX4CZ76_9FLAO|nr:hypothetical protein [Flavobacterium plurextorum]OXB10960.1 hypothetical protein B0A81_03075 [Flavobacterium plurextorum]
MSDFKIIGNPNPAVGVEEFYTVSDAMSLVLPYQNTAPAGNANFERPVKWEVYVLENRRWRKTKENDKTGKRISYTFFQKSLTRNGIRILVKRGEETARLDIKTHTAQNPKVEDIELLDKSGKKLTKPLSYGQNLKARVHCLDMEKRTVYVTLWEEDLNGKAGHGNANPRNIIETRSGAVKNGKADIDFLLKPSVGNIASMGNKIHTYYVTTGLKKGKISSNNVDVKDTETPVPPYKGKTTQKEAVKSNVPVQQPKTKASEIPKAVKGKINSVNLTDIAGHKIKGKFKEKQIKVWINSTGLVGKEVRLKLYDEDLVSNDLLFTHNFTIQSDLHAIVVSLDSIPRSLGGDNWAEGNEQELFAEIEVLQTHDFSKSAVVNVDTKVFKPDPVESTNKVAKVGGEQKKEKFEKVIGLGKEAILYITSEIATEIKVDRNGRIETYPDYGGFNGMNEYKEAGKIYCKKLPNGKSAFPLYKMYVYRGNKTGEAIKKLKQDIKYKSYENAESTILTVARHTQSNNKNYASKGPIPPNNLNSLYRIRYMQAWNHSGKESFRYRFVDDNVSNLRPLENLRLEVSSGAMTLKGRSSISIDPWKSKDLIGCLGIRNSDGTNHSSCGSEMGDLSASNYKFIYHALNNYLENVIPELTGVYGRRGYSSNERIVVKESKYKEEIKVFALIDNLPELNKDDKLFNLEDARRALRLIYDNYGEEIAKNVEMMYRWECSHFKSGQYKHCGGPGMEATNNNHPTYGWDGEVYNKFPQYTPIGIWEEFENEGMSGRGGNTQVTDSKKRYIKFPSVEAGMVYVAEFLVRHNGNVGRWHTRDVSKQSNYVTIINTTIPRIVNSF